MNESNYTRTITVHSSPSMAFNALTKDIGRWWTRPDMPVMNVGDCAKFTFPPSKTYWTFEATAIEQDRRVEMLCIEAQHVHEGLPVDIEEEWLGTSVNWTISPAELGTTIRLEHVGLVPQLKCYQVCEAGWDLFFVQSLKAYLDSGTGNPHPYDQ